MPGRAANRRPPRGADGGRRDDADGACRDAEEARPAGDPSWVSLRGLPRFEALLRRLNLQDVKQGLASV